MVEITTNITEEEIEDYLESDPIEDEDNYYDPDSMKGGRDYENDKNN